MFCASFRLSFPPESCQWAQISIAQKIPSTCPSLRRVVRYEELVQGVFTKTQEIFNFLGYAWTNQTRDYLEQHTAHDSGDEMSTFRNSGARETRWMRDLAWNFSAVAHIQEKTCKRALELWGYEPVLKAQLVQYVLEQIVKV